MVVMVRAIEGFRREIRTKRCPSKSLRRNSERQEAEKLLDQPLPNSLKELQEQNAALKSSLRSTLEDFTSGVTPVMKAKGRKAIRKKRGKKRRARVLRKKLTDKDMIREAQDFLQYKEAVNSPKIIDQSFLSNLEAQLFRSPPPKRTICSSMNKHQFHDLKTNLDRFLTAKKSDFVFVDVPTPDEEFDFCEVHDEKQKFELALNEIKHQKFRLRKRKKKKKKSDYKVRKDSAFDQVMEHIQERRKYFTTEEESDSDCEFN